jgi:heat shock protein HtpX
MALTGWSRLVTWPGRVYRPTVAARRPIAAHRPTTATHRMIAGDTGLAQRVTDNRRRAVVLLGSVGAIGGVVVGLLSLLVVRPLAAVPVAVIGAAALVATAWWTCEALARHLIRAAPADPVDHARLINLVEGLCIAAGVPRPGLYVVDDPGLNALTMGRSPRHASLVVTSGLLAGLSRIELEAVLAHELSHIKSYDILTSTLAVALFGILGAPARAAASPGPGRVIGWVLLPLSAAAGLGLQLSVGRQRESIADLSGVALTRYPPALVSALEKLQGGGTVIRTGSLATAHLWLGPPVAPPPTGRMDWLGRLFETHPSLDERIQALREL